MLAFHVQFEVIGVVRVSGDKIPCPVCEVFFLGLVQYPKISFVIPWFGAWYPGIITYIITYGLLKLANCASAQLLSPISGPHTNLVWGSMCPPYNLVHPARFM
jgi:hypothetical protein